MDRRIRGATDVVTVMGPVAIDAAMSPKTLSRSGVNTAGRPMRLAAYRVSCVGTGLLCLQQAGKQGLTAVTQFFERGHGCPSVERTYGRRATGIPVRAVGERSGRGGRIAIRAGGAMKDWRTSRSSPPALRRSVPERRRLQISCCDRFLR